MKINEDEVINEKIQSYAYLTAKYELARKYGKQSEADEFYELQQKVKKEIKKFQLTPRQKVRFASEYIDHMYENLCDPYEKELYEDIKNSDDDFKNLYLLLIINGREKVSQKAQNFWYYLLDDNSIPTDFLEKLFKTLAEPTWEQIHDRKYYLRKEIERRKEGKPREYFSTAADY